MSQLLIQHYLNELQTLRRVSGTSRESVVSEAFKTLLKDWGRSRDLIFVPQYEYQTLQKARVYARFFRWASDRVDENGIVAFVSNSSFINSRTWDGFRKTVAAEFNDI